MITAELTKKLILYQNSKQEAGKPHKQRISRLRCGADTFLDYLLGNFNIIKYCRKFSGQYFVYH